MVSTGKIHRKKWMMINLGVPLWRRTPAGEFFHCFNVFNRRWPHPKRPRPAPLRAPLPQGPGISIGDPPIENMGKINGQNRENHPWIYYKYHGNKGIFWETMVGECWRNILRILILGYSAVPIGKSLPFPMGSPKYHHLFVGKTAPILPRKWE